MTDAMDFLRAGAAALQRGDRAGAERRVVRALALVPGHCEGWNILGVLAVSGGDPVAGEGRFRRASACAPDSPAYARSQAECLKRQGRTDRAAALLAGAVRRGVLSPDLACDLGDLRLGMRDVAAATALYRLALVLAPGNARSQNNMAEALGTAERPDAAADAFARLAVLRGTATAWGAAGAALLAAWRQDEARVALRRAVALDPSAAEPWANLGFAGLGRHAVSMAEAAFDRALRLAPGMDTARAGRGTLRMLAGRLRDGAADYEARLSLPAFAPSRSYNRPVWDGRVRPGKTLLIHADRGHGDAIQFIRYAPLLRAQGMRVVFHGPEGLLDLFRASELVDELSRLDGPPPAHDVHIPIMSLIHRMGSDLDSVPAAVPYLRAPDAAARRWADRLAGLRGVKAGLVWHGSVAFPYHRQRSPGFEAVRPLTGIPGVTAVLLQVAHGRSDLERLPPLGPVLDLGTELRDFADTAAAIQALDIVISPCTAVAHLAGALGKPVAVLLDQGAEWRWMCGRTDSPWYPTARLYRQAVFGDWTEPVERLHRDLAALRDLLQDRP
ncbi:Tfp pilus assembly protein PilF [Azospirillum brasilense]|uniref:Tfp pilus assembly protein PilF n=1 Tax=Azospirillum brasilense TaxID=192 RepID=A0A560AK37_AZOBR|nr:tetratricopeptide repeat protein [Azospirillum brasilense]TWA60727.1 Tfp pilus assembly protein PilF [Azospirillum brasilense]